MSYSSFVISVPPKPVPMAISLLSTYKKNTTYDHTANYVNFVGGTSYGREYIFITMRWEE